MNEVYLSKSRYCKCVQCPKILWLKKYKPEVATPEDKSDVFENGNRVGELARGLFGEYINVEFSENLNEMVEKTEELLEYKPNIITEASFNFDNNFCSVDILKNDEDGVEIYEVKSSTKIENIYKDDVSYQYYVLSNLGLNVKRACLVYLNKEYYRGEELDIQQLFNIEDLTEVAISKQSEIQENIDMINKYMKEYKEDNEPKSELSPNCWEPYTCDFWNYCTKDLPRPNIFDVSILGNKARVIKFGKYNEGKITFEDLKDEDLQERAIEQIKFELNNLEPKIEKDAIKKVMDSLKYPLYFVDYETYDKPIPEIVGTNAYQKLPFQYSLHIIKEKGAPIEHKEFLAEIDDKDFVRHFAESLIKDMPENGSVIIYNKAFEPVRNEEIGRMYPDLKPELDRINSNIVDFLEIFQQRHYYTKEMEGSASIKKVLPALYPDDPELNYTSLPLVHDGLQASKTFLSLKGKTKEEQEEIRHGLLVYCELDTFAMVKIWEKFKEIVGEE